MAFYELRQYFVRPGKMDEWVKIMEEEIIPFQVSKGMVICGSFRGETDESAYIWIRRFNSEAEREAQYKAVYETDHWKTKIAPRVPDCLDREKMHIQRDRADVAVDDAVARTPAAAALNARRGVLTDNLLVQHANLVRDAVRVFVQVARRDRDEGDFPVVRLGHADLRHEGVRRAGRVVEMRRRQPPASAPACHFRRWKSLPPRPRHTSGTDRCGWRCACEARPSAGTPPRRLGRAGSGPDATGPGPVRSGAADRRCSARARMARRASLGLNSGPAAARALLKSA